MSTDPTEGKNATAAEAHDDDFFSIFYTSSSTQSNDGDVSYGTSLQGAASAVIGSIGTIGGGIWSVLDTALSVLNEDYDSPASVQSESIISDDSTRGSVDSCEKCSKSCVMGCCRQSKRSKLSTSTSGGGNASIKSQGRCTFFAFFRTADYTNLMHSFVDVLHVNIAKCVCCCI